MNAVVGRTVFMCKPAVTESCANIKKIKLKNMGAGHEHFYFLNLVAWETTLKLTFKGSACSVSVFLIMAVNQKMSHFQGRLLN